jgi:3-deoxy-D-arabino-heptulosonate 7-phosphate (DAHP) synthase class II
LWSGQIRDKLPPLVEAIKQAGQVVTWVCDPMHGNTESCGRYKTRRFENVRGEVCALLEMLIVKVKIKDCLETLIGCGIIS